MKEAKKSTDPLAKALMSNDDLKKMVAEYEKKLANALDEKKAALAYLQGDMSKAAEIEAGKQRRWMTEIIEIQGADTDR